MMIMVMMSGDDRDDVEEIQSNGRVVYGSSSVDVDGDGGGGGVVVVLQWCCGSVVVVLQWC